MSYVDVCVGPMTSEEIGREISHYLNSCKEPEKLLVSIIRRDDGKFQTRIYMKSEDFKSVCRKGLTCRFCMGIMMDTALL